MALALAAAAALAGALAACTCTRAEERARQAADPAVLAERDDDPAVRWLRQRARPLETAADLSPVVAGAEGARVVLLGEASHGTSEFYTWRTALSRRLAEEQGVSFIVVEGDWPAALAVNRYVLGLTSEGTSARDALGAFEARWPGWMWNNEEVLELIEWLRAHNAGRPPGEQIGFYGMDVYGAVDSIDRVLALVAARAPQKLSRAEGKLECLTRHDDPRDYGRALRQGAPSCEAAMAGLVDLVGRAVADAEPHARFEAEQEARAVVSAERYYRASAQGNGWNARVDHMFETVDHLLGFHGPDARGVVWAHNTHVGDARATTMADRGHRNIGQLTRQAYGAERVYAVGFGTHRGQVIAGRQWAGPRSTMEVPPAKPDSVEDLLHRLGQPALLLTFDDEDRAGEHGALREHRAIGVLYHPESEHLGNYVPTRLPQRYDAFLFFDETRALTPL
jgi:erythromycin esterase